MENNKIHDYLKNNKWEKLLDNDLFDLLLNYFIDEMDYLSVKQQKLLLKIIFNKIMKLNGNLNNEKLKIIYNNLNNINNSSYKLLNKFINYYDNLSNSLNQINCINNQIDKIYKNQIDNKTEFLKELYKKFCSIFELNYGKVFIKQLYSTNETTHIIHSKEILNRIKILIKIFPLKILSNIGINIITQNEFNLYTYSEKVLYFDSIYKKLNLFFNKYQNEFNNIKYNNNKIKNIIKIDSNIYNDIFNDNIMDFDLSPYDDTNSNISVIEKFYLMDDYIES